MIAIHFVIFIIQRLHYALEYVPKGMTYDYIQLEIFVYFALNDFHA